MPFPSGFSFWRWQGRPPLLQRWPVLQAGPLQAGLLKIWLLHAWRLLNARPVLRSRLSWRTGLGRRTRPLLQPLPIRKVR